MKKEFWYITLKTKTNTYCMTIPIHPIDFLLNNDTVDKLMLINQLEISEEQYNKLYDGNAIGPLCNFKTPTEGYM